MNIMPEEKKESTAWEIIKVIIISLLIVIPIRTWIAQPFIVEGASMEPNFHNGEYLIIDELSYAFGAPKRGEVIIFRYPLQPSEFFIKRIIGLPGETVEIKTGQVFVNDAVVPEQYLPKNLQTGPDKTVQLEDNQYFVMGDNRTASSDSRVWGPLPKKNITGRVFLRLWPIAKAGIVPT